MIYELKVGDRVLTTSGEGLVIDTVPNDDTTPERYMLAGMVRVRINAGGYEGWFRTDRVSRLIGGDDAGTP